MIKAICVGERGGGGTTNRNRALFVFFLIFFIQGIREIVIEDSLIHFTSVHGPRQIRTMFKEHLIRIFHRCRVKYCLPVVLFRVEGGSSDRLFVAFSPQARIFFIYVLIYLGGGGGQVRRIISRCAFFFFLILINLYIFFFRSARAHHFHSLWQGQSTVAERAETTVHKASLTSCV